MKSKNFQQNQIVEFSKKAKVYDLENKTEFEVPKKTTAKVILDEDAGEVGSIKLRLRKKDGATVLVETDDKFLKAKK